MMAYEILVDLCLSMHSHYNHLIIVPSIILPYPLESWIKINCDGAEMQPLGLTSCGGVIRDNNGVFVFTFSCTFRIY